MKQMNSVVLFFIFFLITSCSSKKISMYPKKEIKNQGNFIGLAVGMSSTFFDSNNDCENRGLMVRMTYLANTDKPNNSLEVQRISGYDRYEVKKEDIYLVHQNKKILPTKIYFSDHEFDYIKSDTFSFLKHDYKGIKRWATKYIIFPLKCSALPNSETKLVIAKIYQDNKVFLENIEFKIEILEQKPFEPDLPRGGRIWLE